MHTPRAISHTAGQTFWNLCRDPFWTWEVCIAQAHALRLQCSFQKQLWNTEHQCVCLFRFTFNGQFCYRRIKYHTEDAKARGAHNRSCSGGVCDPSTIVQPQLFFGADCTEKPLWQAGRTGCCAATCPPRAQWENARRTSWRRGRKAPWEDVAWGGEHAKLCRVAQGASAMPSRQDPSLILGNW